MNSTARPRVIGYARLSKNPDGTLTSVADQEAAMRRYAEANGLDLIDIYHDDNRSAWRTDRTRKGWETFLAALAEDGVDGALSYHFDRLARNGRDGERFLGIMEIHSLSLWTPQQIMDLGANADARMVFRFLVAVAINQSDSTSRRVRFHKDERRRAGNLRYVLGSEPPPGLRNGEDDWQTDPASAAALREVARRVLADPEHRLPAAVADAGRAGFAVTYHDGRPATVKAIRAALQRPASAGLMTDRDGEIITYEPVIAEPPLDLATFRRLRAMFAGRKSGRRQAVDRSLFVYAPFLRCARCGNQLTGGWQYDRRRTGEVRADGRNVTRVVGRRPVYGCRTAHKRLGVAKACRGVSVPAEDANAVMATALDGWRDGNRDYREAAARRMATSGREAEVNDQLDVARADLADLIENRRYIGAARYQAGSRDLRAEIDRLEAELDTVAQVADQALPSSAEAIADMTPAEVRALCGEALAGPVVVSPGMGGARAISAIDRMAVEDALAA